MKLASSILRVFLCTTVTVSAASGFPLEDPCLRTCSNDDITSTILQTCIDQCMMMGHCSGNRLNGECLVSSDKRLSCANGCEIAFYTSTVDECKSACDDGNTLQKCHYKHPNINTLFNMCGKCEEGCDESPEINACSDGCDIAASTSEFYKYVKVPEGVCNHTSKPRFLFGGQSNMEGWSEQALPGSFRELIRIISQKEKKNRIIKRELREHLRLADGAQTHTVRNEARLLVSMKKNQFLWKKEMLNDHPTSTCSFTNPHSMKNLDCERPLSSTACGGGHHQYGPEFMFGHTFPKLDSPLQGQAIGISKIAQGGTKIFKNWMKENKDDDDNYWNALVDTIKGAKGSLEAFVWFQGESDSFADWDRETYLDNLKKFVADVRQEIFDSSTNKFALPTDIPVIIVELGYWIYRMGHLDVIEAQRTLVDNDPNTAIVKTGASTRKRSHLTAHYHYNSASQLIIGNRIAHAMAKLLLENEERLNSGTRTR